MAVQAGRDTRVALVAGATRGAGRAIAMELARAGLFVYATGRSSRVSGRSKIDRPETINETGDRIRAVQMGVNTHLITCRAAIPLMLRTPCRASTREITRDR